MSATPEALEVIERLRAAHGPLVFFQSGGCCEGSVPMCFGEAEMLPGGYDVQLGTVGGAPFYVDEDQDERWGHPTFTIDVAEGPADSFSLEGLEGVHFVTRTEEPLSCETP